LELGRQLRRQAPGFFLATGAAMKRFRRQNQFAVLV